MLNTIAAFDRIGEENAFAVLARATERLDQQIAFQTKLIQQAQADLDGLLERDKALVSELESLSARQQAAETEIRAADEKLAALPLEELTAQLAQLRTSVAVASQAADGIRPAIPAPASRCTPWPTRRLRSSS